MFTSYPRYDRYRTLKLTTPMMEGEDVFALQTALKAVGFDPLGCDGVLGPHTQRAIQMFQSSAHLYTDGLAGPATQTALCKKIGARETNMRLLPIGLLMGQLTHESSCRLGNYSDLRSNGSFDAGVAQRNTEHTLPEDGFNVPGSINALAFNDRSYFDKFVGVPDITRRWTLAAGAWNAPAFACYLARQEGATKVKISETAKPSAAALALFEEYMESVTAFMT